MKHINIIGLTQGSNIDVYIKLIDSIKNQKKNYINSAGAYVSFARFFCQSKVVSKNKDVRYLKEWEIFNRAKKTKNEISKIYLLNKKFGSNLIWQCIIGDRRIIYGKHSKSIQDYKLRFKDEFLYNLIFEFTNSFESFVDELQPNIAIGFTPVTFGELLAFHILKNKKIPVIQLHSSRIGNYFSLHDNLKGTSNHIIRIMNNPDQIKEISHNAAEKYINQIKQSGIVYEGINLKKKNYNKDNIFKSLLKFPSAIKNEIIKFSNPVFRNDHHDNGHLAPWFYENVIQVMRSKSVDKFIRSSGRLINNLNLKNTNFAFFPLHSEPEVALQVLGFPYHKNQIELIRSIAASLPFGMSLLVKEHPRSFGMRPISFYKDLLNIPNLYFSENNINSINLVKLSSIVFVISSTIGLEAAIIGKPLIILGYPKYLSLPNTMYRQSLNLFNLGQDIENILNNYKYDQKNLELFISSLIQGSVKINLYSVLLKKPNRFSYLNKNQSIKDIEKEEYLKLSEYTLNRIEEELSYNNEKIN